MDNCINFHNFKILVENASAGRQIIQEFQKEMPIFSIIPGRSKRTRFESVLFLFRNRTCRFPRYKMYRFKKFEFMRWVEDEIFSFPSSKYSDTVDTISQFLNYQLYAKDPLNKKTSSIRI